MRFKEKFKNWLWQKLVSVFKHEVDLLVSQEVESYKEKSSKQSKDTALMKKYPIGTRVIVRSNESEALIIGEVQDYISCQYDGQLQLKIFNFDNKKTFIVYDGEPAYYSLQRLRALNKLTWSEQWSVLNKFTDLKIRPKRSK